MTVMEIRICFFILFLNITIESLKFGGERDTPMSVNGPNEDPPKGLKVTSCGNNNLGKVLGVYMTECYALPCVFKKKKKYNFFIEFSPNEDYSSLNANVAANLFGMKTPLDTLSGDVCDKLLDDQKCPLKQGETYVFVATVDVDEVVPSTFEHFLRTSKAELKITLEIKNQGKKDKFCIAFTAKIQ